MAMTAKEIAWIAGILEGEGTFGLANKGRTPCIWLSMTDGDVVERVRNILDKSQNIRIQKDERKENYKDNYRISISGTRAIQWMMTIYSFMSLRRKAKINEAILAWKTTDVNFKLVRAKHSQLSYDISGLSMRLSNLGYDENTIKVAIGMKRLGMSEVEIRTELLDKIKIKSLTQ